MTTPAKSKIQRAAEEMMRQEGFLGVPVETFEAAGRSQLIELLQQGLLPESRLLDFGCGCLRIAYWLVRFLDPNCYFGIEPARNRVQAGLRYLFNEDIVRTKRPRFDYNANFDSSAFRETFDFFLARSIWTHGSKAQIEATLDAFVRDANPGAKFLTSYLPAETAQDDYDGAAWVGTSHECDVPGVIKHRLSWIQEECEKRRLTFEELPGLDCDWQLWLCIRAATAAVETTAAGA